MTGLSVAPVTMIITWGALVVNNPYLMAALFGQVLILLTCLLGGYSKFIGFILFLVYVGGIMILISYCVMLMPSNKFVSAPMIMAPVMGALGVSLTQSLNMNVASSFAYGLLYSASSIFLVAVLLYLVMLAVVGIIDYSSGMMKMYDKYSSLHYNKSCNLYSPAYYN